MQVTRIFTGDDGESHFEDVDVEMEESGLAGLMSAPVAAKSVIFREVTGDYKLDFHCAPRRQYVVNLTGSVEIENGLGETRLLGPGSILLAEDTTGRGHISRAVESQSRQCLFIPLA
ncbi:MAG: hypothetical protein HOM44_16230 [Gammaproteobacteria bacterium]|jgi:hypothetical protein|nr:hypothetical protein [Gammaproteobacteria bacterium]MBT5155634.1 hypothetical protein [Gammaproteobacteria bacterium]MBT6892289.1 hypothetical protein [Gammaproteobacteria bacterium]MBT7876703.1 hypothetical protein [Gammaproteobacteria bacterium]MDG1231520.1 hypothetical protein [Pseudomonadales bacterium]